VTLNGVGALLGLITGIREKQLGKRIAAIMPAEEREDQEAQNHVIFLENLFDELRRRAPAGK
jgi:hypothetical protein